MSKGPSNFRITDLRRGWNGLEKAGAKVKRVEIQPGKIVFILDGDTNEKPDSESQGEIIL